MIFDVVSKYVDLEWSIIPLQYKSKIPVVRWEQYQNERASKATVSAWFNHNAPINVGVVTGKISNIVVLDIDDINETKGKYLPPTPVARTGRGGLHYFYKWPGKTVKNFVRTIKGMDLRGDGGMIVLPPSVHPNGNTYEWLVSPVDTALADMPPWLMEACNFNVSVRTTIPVVAVDEYFPLGQRNARLASFAGTMRKRGMSQDTITAALLSENQKKCKPALPVSEVLAIAASIATYKPDETFQNYMNYDLTHEGSAELMVSLNGSNLRYDVINKNWFMWNGFYWVESRNADVNRLVIKSTRKQREFATTITDEKVSKRVVAWSLRCENSPHTEAVTNHSSEIESIRMNYTDFNPNPMLLACENGTINLTTGTLQHPNRDDLITNSSKINFDPTARCDRWLQFLDEVFCKDEKIIDFVQKAVGYSLTGLTKEQCIFMCVGDGSNGKSVFLNTISALVGDYAKTTSFDALTSSNYDSQRATNDIAALCGSRLVTASEVSEGKKLSEVRVKMLTGEDKVSTRFLFKEYFTFIATFKMWLAVNHRPGISGNDNGIWRRIRVIPFDARFEGVNIDRDLGKKLIAELPGILNWAVTGCLKWQESDLVMPEKIEKLVKEYRSDMDVIRNFLNECVEMKPSGEVIMGTLYSVYRQWCEDNGERPASHNMFGRKLQERGIGKRGTGPKYYTGISMPKIDV